MTAAQSKRLDLRFSSSRLRFIIVRILVIIVCLYVARVTYNTSTFFSLMENIHLPWKLGVNPDDPIEPYLSDLKQTARFVLNAPKIDRRIMIVIYNSYLNTQESVEGKYTERAVNLHLLQCLVFDVPQEYPSEKARSFGAILWASDKVPYQTEGVSNMLWPLGYDHDRLTITAPLSGLHSYYDGAREYNYFSSQFNFRSIDELK
jgi:hypothetical protein